MRLSIPDDDPVDIQMAPLIDCVFLLLIFFLVATTLKKPERQLNLKLPESSAAVTMPVSEDMLILAVDREGHIFVAGQPATNSLLHGRVRETARKSPSRRIRIDADRDARFQDVLRLMDLCHFEGLKNVGLHVRDNP